MLSYFDQETIFTLTGSSRNDIWMGIYGRTFFPVRSWVEDTMTVSLWPRVVVQTRYRIEDELRAGEK